MAIQINDVSILMPIEHRWLPTGEIGRGGHGNIVLSAIWSYELKFETLTAEKFNELFNIWFNNQDTAVTVTLPELGASSYTYKSYTAYVGPPTYKTYFEGSYSDVQVILDGIDITV